VRALWTSAAPSAASDRRGRAVESLLPLNLPTMTAFDGVVEAYGVRLFIDPKR
jgi:hypothetical protein